MGFGSLDLLSQYGDPFWSRTPAVKFCHPLSVLPTIEAKAGGDRITIVMSKAMADQMVFIMIFSSRCLSLVLLRISDGTFFVPYRIAPDKYMKLRNENGRLPRTRE